MDFTGEAVTSHGVIERRFEVTGRDEAVPGIVWSPEGASGERPLVLVGHGGSGDKRMPYVLSLARRLVRHQGWAVAAIDGPGHGDRARPSEGAARQPGDGISRTFVEQVSAAAETMTADWTTTLTELRHLPEVGHGAVGYWGLSMGTMFGAPFVAATPDVRCAVLGLMGEIGDGAPWVTAAPEVRCPVLFLAQTDDELVTIDRAVGLFRALGSADKRLHAHPGAHSAVPLEEVNASEWFLAQHLS